MAFALQKRFFLALSCVLFAALVCGCNSQRDKLETFNNHYAAGNYTDSSAFAEKQLKQRKKPKGNDLLWALQAGSVKRVQGDFAKSTEFFDQAEAALKYYDLNKSKFLDGIAATVVNDNAVAYLGQEYDGVMVNVYKGLNFISEGKRDLARVEFNRALDRQRRAKENFGKEIARLRKKIDKKAGGKNGGTVKQSVDNPKVNEIIAERYPDLSAFEVYPDFINPFATYLAGLFFNLEGDYGKGVDLIKESCGMVPENEYIAMDLAETELALSDGNDIDGVCWVIFENGLGPVKDEWRVDLPLFIATDNVKYFGIALPKLMFRDRAYSRLVVEAGGEEYSTDIVADMDRVVQTEFKQQYPAIVTRAVMSATLKAVAQYAIEKQNDDKVANGLFSLLAAVYSFATTSADVRVWTALPKEFQVARFDIPEDGKIVIRGSGNAGAGMSGIGQLPLEIELADCKNALIYVKIIRAGVAPVCDVMLF
jgi:hypothetical protein